jgi:hypothetical protein
LYSSTNTVGVNIWRRMSWKRHADRIAEI